MLLELADECKQQIWGFLGVRELCRVAGVARNVEQGVHMGPIWQRHARTLLAKGQAALRGDSGVLSCRLQRGNASRNLLATGDTRRPSYGEDGELLEVHNEIDWRLWYRDTHVVLVRFRTNNEGFAQALASCRS